MGSAERDRKFGEGMGEPQSGIKTGRSSYQQPGPRSEVLRGRGTGRGSEGQPESDPEVHPEPDPESSMALKRLTSRNDSFLIATLTKFRVGLGVGLRADVRVDLRPALDLNAWDGMQNGINANFRR